MSWKLNNDRPIYIQLLEQLLYKIVSGEFAPGARLPSVRELAADAAVNPNTMQRAFAELEVRGLVCTQRTAGRTITDDIAVIEKERTALAETQVNAFIDAMIQLGFTKSEAINFLMQTKEEK